MPQSSEKINVLDKGFVRLVDFMGGDDRAVQSARVSFGAVSKGPEQDKRLIKYLMEHAHHTPFEHCYFQFHICCPILSRANGCATAGVLITKSAPAIPK